MNWVEAELVVLGGTMNRAWNTFWSYITLANTQAVLTLVIGFAAVYIARQQWRTNAYKVKLDLFDRRFRVFERVRDILALMFTEVSNDNRLRDLLLDTRDAEFLFGVDINNYIEDVYRRASTLSHAHKQLRASPNAPVEQRERLSQIEQDGVTWATEQRRNIAAKFKDALDLSKL
jgi:hypothetical protein